MTRWDLALVGCTKSKREPEGTVPARDLYDESPLFRRRRRLARRDADDWAILSAEHGVVDPDAELGYYDTHISGVETEAWAEDVLEDLAERVAAGDRIGFLVGGSGYIDPLIPRLTARGVQQDVPLYKEAPGRQFNILDDLWETPTEGSA